MELKQTRLGLTTGKANQIVFQRKGRPRPPLGGSEGLFVQWIKGSLVKDPVFTASSNCAKKPKACRAETGPCPLLKKR